MCKQHLLKRAKANIHQDVQKEGGWDIYAVFGTQANARTHTAGETHSQHIIYSMGVVVFVSGRVFLRTSKCMFVRTRAYTVWSHNWISWPHMTPAGIARVSGHKTLKSAFFIGRRKSFDLSLGSLWSFLRSFCYSLGSLWSSLRSFCFSLWIFSIAPLDPCLVSIVTSPRIYLSFTLVPWCFFRMFDSANFVLEITPQQQH